jgi:hypothetical protein
MAAATSFLPITVVMQPMSTWPICANLQADVSQWVRGIYPQKSTRPRVLFVHAGLSDTKFDLSFVPSWLAYFFASTPDLDIVLNIGTCNVIHAVLVSFVE